MCVCLVALQDLNAVASGLQTSENTGCEVMLNQEAGMEADSVLDGNAQSPDPEAGKKCCMSHCQRM